MVLSILEIYKARMKRDTGDDTIITKPIKLTGFNIAFKLVNKALDKL